MRDLELSEDVPRPDSPTKTKKSILGARKDYVQIQKANENIDIVKIDLINQKTHDRLLKTSNGKPLFYNQKMKAPGHVKGNKDNGDIITWGEAKSPVIHDDLRNSGKKKINHRDKVTSVDGLFTGRSQESTMEDFYQIRGFRSPQHKKNITLHTSSINFNAF